MSALLLHRSMPTVSLPVRPSSTLALFPKAGPVRFWHTYHIFIPLISCPPDHPLPNTTVRDGKYSRCGSRRAPARTALRTTHPPRSSAFPKTSSTLFRGEFLEGTQPHNKANRESIHSKQYYYCCSQSMNEYCFRWRIFRKMYVNTCHTATALVPAILTRNS